MIAPWLISPFELLVHGELHCSLGEDFDRKIALISFDNAIEAAITTYLCLHPTQRGNRQYPNDQVEKWLHNYHSRLSFLYIECTSRKITPKHEEKTIIYVHSQRNDMYHGSTSFIPASSIVQLSRAAAIWVFETLFEEVDIESKLAGRVREIRGEVVKRHEKLDRQLDDNYSEVEIEGALYPPSEVLYKVDPTYYAELADGWIDEPNSPGA